MGSSLDSTLANVIMTELEKVIVDELVVSGMIKFYIRYVDDTLLLTKPESVDGILRKLNSFDKNLQFSLVMSIFWIFMLIRHLLICFTHICLTDTSLSKQINRIKLFMSWNGYPSAVIKSMFKRLQSTAPKDNAIGNNEEVINIFVRVPFVGERVNGCLSCDQKITSIHEKKCGFC